MSDPRYLDEEQLVGKTIAKVVMTSDELFIGFTDGTFTCVVPDPGYYGDRGGVDCEEPTDRDDLLKFGLITQAEYDAGEAARIAKYDAEKLAKEKKRYEELKLKFG